MNNSQRKEEAIMLDKIKDIEHDYISFIHKRLGIVIRHQMREMYKTISEACNKFNLQPDEYLQKLKNCSDDSPLLEHLVLGVTIGETYFFRDKNQIVILREKILPEIIQQKRSEGNLSLRIWSAGCSSGEEIYTIVMMLYDLLPDIKQWKLNLIGTDINTKSLQKAIAGQYTEWSMRSISEYYKLQYFTRQKNEYHINPEIKNYVSFFYLNLNDDSYPSIFNGTNAQDLILCRNVLIYFNMDDISLIMKRMNSSLVPNGYLLLGASDPLQQTEINLMYSYHHGALQKAKNTMPTSTTVNKPLSVVKSYSSITSHSSHISKPLNKSSAIPLKSRLKSSSFQLELDKLEKEYRWQELLDFIQKHELIEGESKELFSIKATAHANLGQLDKAAQFCKQSLAANPTDKFAYLTYSLILSELNQLNESESALRNALFLDHQFLVGHFQLGLLLLRKKSVKQGLKCLRNALDIAIGADQKKVVPGSQGLSYGHFTDILKHEIDLYEIGNDKYANKK